MPSHHVHQARCSRTCAFFSISDATFDIHYVDDAGKEISMDEALKKRAGRKAKKRNTSSEPRRLQQRGGPGERG
jgi:hypothetical protein